jgi:hypothetical protein
LEGDVQELGGCFSVFEALGNHAEGEGLNAGYGFISIRSVAHDSGKQGYFGQPTAVVFTFKFD